MGIDIDHWEEKPIMYFKGQIARNYVMETNNIKKKIQSLTVRCPNPMSFWDNAMFTLLNVRMWL